MDYIKLKITERELYLLKGTLLADLERHTKAAGADQDVIISLAIIIGRIEQAQKETL